ncbi:hypothetical protein ACFVYR_20920 [Streptomyces sp. NPDC058284]|uniref:hypothetical protein n=1 Tax=unclassified Streptomyces TaxID=2593676 RepID=UPI00365309EC
MPEVQLEAAGVQGQYATQVASDLETNRKEQERIATEIAALQEQLQRLEHDHSLLVRVQEALSTADTATPGPKKKTIRQKSAPKPQRNTSTAGGTRTKTSAAKSTPVPKVPAARSGGPTLVELVRDHLDQHSEPRSAAEITSALTKAYPERSIKTTVVRTTLEGLVAKGLAQRSKQGSSVFYDSATPAEQTSAPQPTSATS